MFFFLFSGDEDKPEKPHFDSRSLIFELDPCNGNGKVCLVYKHAKPGKTKNSKVCHFFLQIVPGSLVWNHLTFLIFAIYR